MSMRRCLAVVLWACGVLLALHSVVAGEFIHLHKRSCSMIGVHQVITLLSKEAISEHDSKTLVLTDPLSRNPSFENNNNLNNNNELQQDKAAPKVDLVLALDASSDVSKNNFKKLQEFASGLVDKALVNSGQLRVALLSFSSKPTLHTTLNKHSRGSKVVKAIKFVHYCLFFVSVFCFLIVSVCCLFFMSVFCFFIALSHSCCLTFCLFCCLFLGCVS